MTTLLAISKAGELLPPQLIYQGKTDGCHPKFVFPESFDVYHSENHWSNEETMLRYIETVISPYINHVIVENDLPLAQKALCIFDVFAAHRCEAVLKLLEKKKIRVVFVPAACTDKLQPLDLLVNHTFKQYLRQEFQNYYAMSIKKCLETSDDMSMIDIDLRMSVIKELHAQWLVNAYDKLGKEHELMKKAFACAGLDGNGM